MSTLDTYMNATHEAISAIEEIGVERVKSEFPSLYNAYRSALNAADFSNPEEDEPEEDEED